VTGTVIISHTAFVSSGKRQHVESSECPLAGRMCWRLSVSAPTNHEPWLHAAAVCLHLKIRAVTIADDLSIHRFAYECGVNSRQKMSGLSWVRFLLSFVELRRQSTDTADGSKFLASQMCVPVNLRPDGVVFDNEPEVAKVHPVHMSVVALLQTCANWFLKLRSNFFKFLLLACASYEQCGWSISGDPPLKTVNTINKRSG